MHPADFDPDNTVLLWLLRKLAEHAAHTGGTLARASFDSAHAVRRKADGSEVTDADEAAQAAIVAAIRDQQPYDHVIAEETAPPSDEEPRASARAAAPVPRKQPALPTPANDRLCWIIDPIDGTRNYIRGVPLYAVSVAAMFDGYPLVGAIFVPDRGDMYSVSKAEGLLINGQPAPARPVEPHPPGRESKPLVGIPSSLQGGTREVIESWIPRVVVRNLGSTAMHLAMVAAGSFQAALMSDSKLWDIAAGWLMVTATGGVMTTLDGRPVFPLDVARYAGESIPSLASRDPQTHARLLPAANPPL